ncbi:hypothetical protein DRO61_07550, partial [Candidatus Bathyarchaeota archaeon]
MPRTRRRRTRRRRSVIPRPISKGVKQITAITSKVARGIDKYPLAALRKVGKEVLKPRKFPGLRGGGTSCCTRLRPGAFRSVSAKKGGRKRRRGGRRTRKGGRRTRKGGRSRR